MAFFFSFFLNAVLRLSISCLKKKKKATAYFPLIQYAAELYKASVY